eukprot:scaffold21778_cov131-Isochrysis_galbana.AAC.3
MHIHSVWACVPKKNPALCYVLCVPDVPDDWRLASSRIYGVCARDAMGCRERLSAHGMGLSGGCAGWCRCLHPSVRIAALRVGPVSMDTGYQC